MPEYIVHTLITLVALPTISFIIVRLVNKADLHRDKEETQWRNQVISRFVSLENKLSNYCAQNNREHYEMDEATDKLRDKVIKIETIQNQKGCTLPGVRRDA